MRKIPAFGGAALLCLVLTISQAQDAADGSASNVDKVADFPTKVFNKINGRTTALQQQLKRQTARYLMRMAKSEDRLRTSLYNTDSVKAAQLYPQDPKLQYAALLQRFQQDSSRVFTSMGPEYLPHADSLQAALGFLSKNPALVGANPALQLQMQGSLANFQNLQAKLQDADGIKQFMQSRQARMQQVLGNASKLPSGVSSALAGYNRQAYYYADQVRAYRAVLNDPNRMMQTALVLLNKLPAFASFMKRNSFLSGLFGVPAGYGTEQGLVGLQTHDQVMAMIQSKIGQGGPNAASSLQNSVNSAQQDIAKLQNKLSSMGGGSGDIPMPDFKTNDQHSKTFLHRLEYGFDLQTTRGTLYFPAYTDIGISVGYNLGHQNSIGAGASFKVGWGTDWQHIALSGQGVGLRSFVDIHLKKTFSLTGGLELNYLQPFSSFKAIPKLSGWTQSGLIGISKTISSKSTLLKKTRVSFFWDFLSYYQIPRQPPVIFRLGYGF